jgi:PTH1 family peptidyl-tRNA hydrolase
MNLSGTAVNKLLAFFKADVNSLIVVHDDLDLSFGRVRLKIGGGNAGHKGLASIAENLGSCGFIRVRLGIGKPEEKSRIEGYVLEPFKSEELSLLPDVIQTAAGAVSEIILSGMEKAMAKYHKKNISNSLKKEEDE